jgi:DNA-binding NarL/FixJ family response regulator
MVAQPAVPLSVFLADDHPIVLAGVKALVLEDDRFQVVGEARDGVSALEEVLRLQPNILILDISMPGMNGVEVAEVVLRDLPACKILTLTVHEDRGYLRQLLRMGVSGYLLKRSAAEELIRALTAIAAGGLYLDPAVAEMAVAQHAPRRVEGPVGVVELSQREMDVLKLTASGHSNKSVAAELGIGVKSAETYKARAMEKLGFRTRVEVVRFALGKGWLVD